jgi:uncharacterized membrane protein
MSTLLTFAITLAVFVALDMTWLILLAKDFYRQQLGALTAPKVNLFAAVAFYLVYCAGLVVFAVKPALASGNWTDAALYGAALGFVAYATYDLTNLATLRDWPVALTVVDLAWGTVASGVACAVAVRIIRALT